jgi:hypothetical protein
VKLVVTVWHANQLPLFGVSSTSIQGGFLERHFVQRGHRMSRIIFYIGSTCICDFGGVCGIWGFGKTPWCWGMSMQGIRGCVWVRGIGSEVD